ncbi:GTP cyclohydrolase II [Caldalkalibacillus salinus]|uniref:GTP cyclohydrolase II n=1 Tax=Caldalkalibacillus salinus TaxID=2803787 RepID=UPI00192311CB|nr:GTP cyclohydrolase II [Caldalkalibacillus salinus]
MKITYEQQIKDTLASRLSLLYDDDGHPLYLFGPVNLPVKLKGEDHTLKWYTWLKEDNMTEDPKELIEELPQKNLAQLQQSSVLVYGDFAHAEEAAVRVHSICHTGDIFGSQRCDCGSQLQSALQKIIIYGAGALIYVADHEGRGIGLFSKAMTYALQEEGLDTAEANVALGYAPDQRDYGDVALVLKHLRQRPITLLTNNPDKKAYLRQGQVDVKRVESAVGEVSVYNQKYLETKIETFNHTISRREITLGNRLIK